MLVILVDVIKFTGFSCLLAQFWPYRANREHEMKQLKRKCLLRLNNFSRMQSETNLAFCNCKSTDVHVWIEESVPRVKKI